MRIGAVGQFLHPQDQSVSCRYAYGRRPAYGQRPDRLEQLLDTAARQFHMLAGQLALVRKLQKTVYATYPLQCLSNH
ncbi:MAG: hypothetical protein ACYSUV_13585 [Planctomycetota bacterium]